jgi:hypothetical protein
MPTMAPETTGIRIHTNANATDRREILSMYFTATREEMIVFLQAVSTTGLADLYKTASSPEVCNRIIYISRNAFPSSSILINVHGESIGT